MFASAAVTRGRSRPSRRAVTVAVLLAAVGYAILLTLLSWKRHHDFHSGYDLAIFTQLTWLLGHGLDPFSTVRGRPMLGDHFQPGLALLAPLGDVPGGPALLLAAQSTALAATAPLLFAVARARGARDAVAAAVAIVWLASPLTHSANLFDFHPETFVPALLAAGALGLERERTSLFLVTAVVACSLKEDVSLVYLAWGVLLTASPRRRLGLAVAVGAAAWFVLATRVGIDAFGGSLDYYSHRFGGGNSASVGSVARDLVLHPLRELGAVTTTLNAKMVLALVASTAGLCLFAPRILALAILPVAVNILSRYPQQHYLTLQYHIVPAGICALAGAYGAARLRIRVRAQTVAAAVAAVVVADVVLSPATGVARGNYAQPGPVDGQAASARRAALALVPSQAAVAAQFDVVAQLAQRRLVYVLPQPFLFLPHEGDTWSRRELARRAKSVRWVLLDDGSSYPGEPGQLKLVRRRLPTLGFRTVFARDGVTLLRR